MVTPSGTGRSSDWCCRTCRARVAWRSTELLGRAALDLGMSLGVAARHLLIAAALDPLAATDGSAARRRRGDGARGPGRRGGAAVPRGGGVPGRRAAAPARRRLSAARPRGPQNSSRTARCRGRGRVRALVGLCGQAARRPAEGGTGLGPVQTEELADVEVALRERDLDAVALERAVQGPAVRGLHRSRPLRRVRAEPHRSSKSRELSPKPTSQTWARRGPSSASVKGSSAAASSAARFTTSLSVP